VQRLLLPLEETKALPFNQGVNAFEKYFEKKRYSQSDAHETALHKSKNA
jgi:hypothetical protein